MTARRQPKKAALVLTDDDRAVLSSLPDDERAMVEDIMRRHAGLTAAEALQTLHETEHAILASVMGLALRNSAVKFAQPPKPKPKPT